MTSEGCFVLLQMPGRTEVVTCGRFALEDLDDGSAVGRFVYGERYLARPDAVPLDPFNLPLVPTEFRTARLGGLFGALRDAGPDAWGRRVIERRHEGLRLTELDYLLRPAAARIGALEFADEVATELPGSAPVAGPMALDHVRAAARAVEDDRPVDLSLEALLLPGSSLGGARPKTVIRDAEGLWLVKFPQRGDRWSNAAVEGGMLRLARRCGIEVPESRVERLGDEQILLVKRFDRDSNSESELRHRMVSALTVLDLDDRVTDRSGWSYLALADELQRWSERPVEDQVELFRRVAFNALISNNDDHPRNHALIAPGRAWRLSPAYDLTPSRAVSLERRDLAMVAGRRGRLASRQNLLSASPRFGLGREDADALIDEMKGVVESCWRQDIRAAGGSERDCEAASGAFVYPGFELVRE